MTYHFNKKEWNWKKSKKKVFILHDKTEYVIHIRNLKQTLNPGSILKIFHRVIKLNQKFLLKPYVDMNTKLKSKKYFWGIFF